MALNISLSATPHALPHRLAFQTHHGIHQTLDKAKVLNILPCTKAAVPEYSFIA